MALLRPAGSSGYGYGTGTLLRITILFLVCHNMTAVRVFALLRADFAVFAGAYATRGVVFFMRRGLFRVRRFGIRRLRNEKASPRKFQSGGMFRRFSYKI
ncbi:hypothetical protein CAFE_29230 [Caprobacter fermentans]|uniref:Uncharacterized protein n=1 Tax=Caproicibacter fermentans TaxID=2576756 RepID=A0A6N8I253_9FIRM|nr:hypothetical protein [Caproicibacter fermentans]OCN01160.1 hypothetical protein A7X67_07255 [Clostridium sp. W14A]